MSEPRHQASGTDPKNRFRKALVLGGFNYVDKQRIWDEMDGLGLDVFDLVVSYAAPGRRVGAYRTTRFTDILVEWTEKRGVHLAQIRMLAGFYGTPERAAPIRNGVLIDILRPDMALFFPGGDTVQDALGKVRRREIPYRKIDLPAEVPETRKLRNLK